MVQLNAQGQIASEILGFPPGCARDTQITEVEKFILTNPTAKRAIENYIVSCGVPQKSVTTAVVSSLARAYVIPAYLKSWRNRTNPSWRLLGNENEVYAHGSSAIVREYTEANPPQAQGTPAGEAASVALTQAAPNSGVTAEGLRDLFAQINASVNKLVAEKLDNTELKISDNVKNQIRDLATSAAQARIDELARPQEIIVKREGEASAGTNIGLQHHSFAKLLRACSARNHQGFRLNIWLTGPTGSGKTTAAENVAKALALNFGSDGSLDADYKVLGFVDANGNIISTQFLNIYENGGIYVADEIDNWMPSALLSLNAALANGWVSAPGNRMIQRHKDCVIIACANTWGLGATNEYVGRTKLDAASLDRFQPKIDWPIDEKLERALAENQGGELGLYWHETIVRVRAKTKSQGLKVIISPRATFGGIALLREGFEIQEVVDMTIAAGLSPEQKSSLGLTNVPPFIATLARSA